jgi:peptidoglycan/LPS O-acetylase OafA/YrhL
MVMQSGMPFLLAAGGLLVLPVAAITPLAWAMHAFVERPGVALGRRLAMGRAPVRRVGESRSVPR